MFSSDLAHIRFDDTPLLCNACLELVPPSPQLDTAAEQAKDKATLWLMHCVGLKVRSKRNHSGVLVAAAASEIVSNPSNPLVVPQQPAPKRKKYSRGSAIVAAAARPQTLPQLASAYRVTPPHLSTPAQSLSAPSNLASLRSASSNRSSANASWVLELQQQQQARSL
jgi:hypothetical protein